MEELIKLLHTGNYSCVIKSQKKISTFTKRGVADLYELVKNKSGLLQGALIADKVVGKAAAALMLLGGIAELYSDVICLPALTLLRSAGIKVDFESIVPFIENRDRTDWCALEKICHNESTAESILPLIDEFIAKINQAK